MNCGREGRDLLRGMEWVVAASSLPGTASQTSTGPPVVGHAACCNTGGARAICRLGAGSDRGWRGRCVQYIDTSLAPLVPCATLENIVDTYQSISPRTVGVALSLLA